MVKLTIYKCDNCNKEASAKDFPYESGWKYLYAFKGKSDNKKYGLKDKHFCCIRCLQEYLNNYFTETFGEMVKL